MNWIGQTMKYTLYVFNFIFMLCGVFLVTMGGILLSDLTEINALKDDESTAALPICIIILGCVIFVVSFFGCFGAIRANIYCIYLYAIFMLIFFFLELAIIFYMLITRPEYVHTITQVVNDAWNDNDESHGYPMREIEVQHKCCGINGCEDYLRAGLQVPSSCCGSLDTSRECLAPVYENMRGCSDKFYDIWSSNADLIINSGIGIAVIELAALICAYFLIRSILKIRGKR